MLKKLVALASIASLTTAPAIAFESLGKQSVIDQEDNIQVVEHFVNEQGDVLQVIRHCSSATFDIIEPESGHIFHEGIRMSVQNYYDNCVNPVTGQPYNGRVIRKQIEYQYYNQ